MSKTHSNAFLWYSVLFYISTMDAISFKIVLNFAGFSIDCNLALYLDQRFYDGNDVKCRGKIEFASLLKKRFN